jgi:hypothetical protein
MILAMKFPVHSTPSTDFPNLDIMKWVSTMNNEMLVVCAGCRKLMVWNEVEIDLRQGAGILCWCQ